MTGSQYQTPAGAVAVTLDLPGSGRLTHLFKPEEIERICEIVEEKSGFTMADRTSEKAHAGARRFCEERATSRDPEVRQAITMAALWCTVHHPQHAAEFRRQVTAAFEKHGRAHITAACDQKSNWAFAVGGHYIDLHPSLARVEDNPNAPRPKNEGLFG